MRKAHDCRDVHEHLKTEKHNSEECGREFSIDLDKYAHSTENETGSDQINPKHMKRNPRRNDSPDTRRIQVVVYPEKGHGHTDKDRTNEDQLVPIMRLRRSFNRYAQAENQQQNRSEIR